MSNMNNILLFGAGKSATVLIDQLYEDAKNGLYKVHVADMNMQWLEALVTENFSISKVNVADLLNLQKLVSQSDIVVSLLPPSLHLSIAQICLDFKKHFITASYAEEPMKNLASIAAQNQLYFINEMGLDPGIDHLLAMEMIDEVKAEGGQIYSFESYCGGLIAKESDNNPFHYKITWNPLNIVNAGKAGATFLKDRDIIQYPYHDVFNKAWSLSLQNCGNFDVYPNRDSLKYIDDYGLKDINTFVRGTLRYSGFCKIWSKLLVQNLTSESSFIDPKDLSEKIAHCNEPAIDWFYQNHTVQPNQTYAQLLLNLLSERLQFEENDKDRVVLYHLLKYKINGELKEKDYLLDVYGKSKKATAMAQTVGMPIYACIQLILSKAFTKYGLLLPTDKMVYPLVLQKLRNLKVLA